MHITLSSTHQRRGKRPAFLWISGTEIGKKAAVTLQFVFFDLATVKNISVVDNLCIKYTTNKDIKILNIVLLLHIQKNFSEASYFNLLAKV